MKLNDKELFLLEIGLRIMTFEVEKSSLSTLAKAEKIEELNILLKKIQKERD